MIFVELALQGLKGFPERVRLPFKRGINVFPLSEAALRSAVLDVFYHLLYPDPARGSATEALADPKAKEARLALTFYGRDKKTYRLVRDVVSGATKLFTFDKEKKRYELFADSARDVAQYIRVQQHLPDDVAYDRLFLLSPESMASKGEKARTRSGQPIVKPTDFGPPSAPGLPAARGGSGAHLPRPGGPPGGSGAGPMEGGIGSALNSTNALVQAEMDQGPDVSFGGASFGGASFGGATMPSVEEQEKDLAKAEDELRRLRSAEKAQLELDRLVLRRSELEKTAGEIDELKEALQSLRDEKKSFGQELGDLPKGFGDKLRRLESQTAKYKTDHKRTFDEVTLLQAEEGGLEVFPFWKDTYFLVGVGGALIAIVLAYALGTSWLAFLNIPCLLVAAGSAYRWVGELEVQSRAQWRLTAGRERLQRLERQYELDTGVVRRLMEEMNIDEPSEILERYAAFEEVGKEIQKTEARVRVMFQDPAVKQAEKDLRKVRARIEQCEQAVLEAEGSMMTKEVLERRIRLIRKQLGRASEPSAPSSSRREDDGEALVALPGATSPSAPVVAKRPASSSALRLPDSDEPMPLAPPKGAKPSTGSSSEPSTGVLSGPRVPAFPAPPASGKPGTGSLFDFGGGHIGADDDEDEEGYGSGYGAGGGTAEGGPEFGAAEAPGCALMAIGYGGPPGGGGVGSWRSGGSGYGGESSPRPDRSRDLIQTAVDLLQVDVDTLCEKLSPRIGQFAKALTDGKFDRVSFLPRGEASFGLTDGSELTPYVELGGEALDGCDSALRFALVEACLHKDTIPLLMDDPFEHFPADRRRLWIQMLGYFAKATQVFVATAKGDVKGHVVTW